MKSVFIAGSRKFFGEMQEFISGCRKNKIEVTSAGKWDKSKKDTPKSEKEVLLNAFGLIERSDILYVFAKDGHVGKTVAMEIAYAYEKGKKIISSETINDFSVRALVSEIRGTKEFIKRAMA